MNEESIVHANIVDGDDVRMAEAACRARFLLKSALAVRIG